MTFKNSANPGSNEKKSNQLSFDKLFEHWIAVAVLIFALSFGIRLFRLDFHSLWYDEANTASLLQDKPMGEAFDAILGTSGSETLHPLYFLMLSAWMQIAGSSEWALRFPSVVFGSCAALVYTLLLYQVGGKKALAFGLLLIVSPFLMWYSRDARPYALIMFLTGLHLLFYLELFEKPKSKKVLAGFFVTGVLMVYSGIFVGMVLLAEFIWSLFVRRKAHETVTVVLVLLLALPLVWHGYRTHFLKSSGRYYELPKGMSVLRTVSILQEFLVGRSLGPTPDKVRRLPLTEAIYQKSTEVSTETLALILISISFVLSLRGLKKHSLFRELDRKVIQALAFIIIVCIALVGLLILTTGYRMNARHLAFLFGPLFILGVLPVAYSDRRAVKTVFFVPLLAMWTWSCANQLFNSSYETDDYRNAIKIIANDVQSTSQILALCNPRALEYYGVDKPLVYLREGPNVTCNTLVSYLKDQADPAWLVLSRPWNYPSFRPEELTDYFLVLSEKHLPGIDMWLLILPTGK